MSRRRRKEIEGRDESHGQIVACPTCGAACRVGSEYFKKNNGLCPRHLIEMTTAAGARAQDILRYRAIDPPQQLPEDGPVTTKGEDPRESQPAERQAASRHLAAESSLYVLPRPPRAVSKKG